MHTIDLFVITADEYTSTFYHLAACNFGAKYIVEIRYAYHLVCFPFKFLKIIRIARSNEINTILASRLPRMQISDVHVKPMICIAIVISDLIVFSFELMAWQCYAKNSNKIFCCDLAKKILKIV